ncbi:MAG: hypothetical protein ACI9J3_002947 [Parvicellaceae bacterium]|jgi:hypothetical protein
MKYLVLLIVLCGLTLTDFYSQNLSHVVSNKVAADLVVHTVSMSNQIPGTGVQDALLPLVNSSEIETVITGFTGTAGISRATYDKATNTFTILSVVALDINVVLTDLNNTLNGPGNE